MNTNTALQTPLRSSHAHFAIAPLAGLLAIASIGCGSSAGNEGAKLPANPAATVTASASTAITKPQAPLPKGKADANGWAQFGQQEVIFRGRPSTRPSHKTITISDDNNTRIRAVRLAIKGNPFELFRVAFTFEGGQKWEPKLCEPQEDRHGRAFLPAGCSGAKTHVFNHCADSKAASHDNKSCSRHIDLPGPKRIRKVDVWYRSVKPKKGQATVMLFGRS